MGKQYTAQRHLPFGRNSGIWFTDRPKCCDVPFTKLGGPKDTWVTWVMLVHSETKEVLHEGSGDEELPLSLSSGRSGVPTRVVVWWNRQNSDRPTDWLDQAVDYVLDPVTGSPAHGREVLATV